MRNAFTIVEVVVAAVMVAVVLGALFEVLGTARRMNDGARGSAAVASALLLEEALATDLRQLGVDPKREHLFDMNDTGISFYRAVFDGKATRLRPVRWSVRKTKGGNGRLERTEVGPRGPVTTPYDGVLAHVGFATTGDAREPARYLRVTLTVLGEDLSGAGVAERGVEQVLLARIPVPLEVANPELAASTRLLPEGPLLPLVPQ